MVLDYIRSWFEETVPASEHRAVLQCGSEFARAKDQFKKDTEKLKLQHAEELACLKCAFDMSEADLAKKTHELEAAASRLSDLEFAFANMESVIASTEDENTRLKARIAEAVGLLQS